MPTYMTQFTYTGEAWMNLMKNPEDRSAPAAKLLESLGGKLIGHYYMTGDHDGVIIYEAPDAKVAATGLMAAAKAGHMQALKTSQLYTMGEVIEIIGEANKLSFAGPKG